MDQALYQLEEAWLDLQEAHSTFTAADLPLQLTELEHGQFDSLREATGRYMEALDELTGLIAMPDAGPIDEDD